MFFPLSYLYLSLQILLEGCGKDKYMIIYHDKPDTDICESFIKSLYKADKFKGKRKKERKKEKRKKNKERMNARKNRHA